MKKFGCIFMAAALFTALLTVPVAGAEDNRFHDAAVTKLFYDDFSSDTSETYTHVEAKGNTYIESVEIANNEMTITETETSKAENFTILSPAFTYTGGRMIVSYRMKFSTASNVKYGARLATDSAGQSTIKLTSANQAPKDKNYHTITFVVDADGADYYLDGEFVSTSTEAKVVSNTAYYLYLLVNAKSTATSKKKVTYDYIEIYQAPESDVTCTKSNLTGTGCTLTYSSPVVAAPVVTVGGVAATAEISGDYTVAVRFGGDTQEGSQPFSATGAVTFGGNVDKTETINVPAPPMISYTLYEDGADSNIDFGFYGNTSEYASITRADGTLCVGWKDCDFEQAELSKGHEVTAVVDFTVNGDVAVVEYAYEYVGGELDTRRSRIYFRGISSSATTPYQDDTDSKPGIHKTKEGKINVQVILDYKNKKCITYENGVEVYNASMTGTGKEISMYLASKPGISEYDPNVYTAYDYICVYEPRTELEYEVLSDVNAAPADGVRVRFNQPITLSGTAGTLTAGAVPNSEFDGAGYYIVGSGRRAPGEEYSLQVTAAAVADAALTADITKQVTTAGTRMTPTLTENNGVLTAEMEVGQVKEKFSVLAIVAQYNRGVFQQAKAFPVTVEQGEGRKITFGTLPKAEGENVLAKLYLWSADMEPYHIVPLSN